MYSYEYPMVISLILSLKTENYKQSFLTEF